MNSDTDPKIILNGDVISNDSPGSSQMDMTTGRLGSLEYTGYNWIGFDGNAIAEIIIFTCDPSLLPGWADFVAESRTYFGTA